MQRALEPVQCRQVAFGLRLDSAVRQVSDEPPKTFSRSRTAGEEAKPDALDAALDDELSSSNHLVSLA